MEHLGRQLWGEDELPLDHLPQGVGEGKPLVDKGADWDRLVVDMDKVVVVDLGLGTGQEGLGMQLSLDMGLCQVEAGMELCLVEVGMELWPVGVGTGPHLAVVVVVVEQQLQSEAVAGRQQL